MHRSGIGNQSGSIATTSSSYLPRLDSERYRITEKHLNMSGRTTPCDSRTKRTHYTHYDPLCITIFLQPLKLAILNLVHNLGLGLAYQKQRLGPKLAGVWARGASKKIWDPLLIYATVEASNFKFGTQLGFGISLLNKKLSYRREAARCLVLLSILVSR